MVSESTRTRSGKGVTLSIAGTLLLLGVCGGGIYLYAQIDPEKGAAIQTGLKNGQVKDTAHSGQIEISVPAAAINRSAQKKDVRSETPVPSMDDIEITPLENKLNAYIDCLNRFADIRKAMAVYFSWRDDGLQPPNCSERRISRGMPPVYSDLLTECEALITAGNEMAPDHPELHRAGQKYVKLLGKTLPIMKQMTGYYAKKRYAEDDCLTGRIFHAQLLKQFGKLQAQEKVLRDMVLFQAHGGLASCVERTAGHPDKVALHAWAALIENGQAAMQRFYAAQHKASADLRRLDAQLLALNAQMKTFESLPQDMTDTYDTELFDEFNLAVAAFIKQDAGKTPGEKVLGIGIQNGLPVVVRTGSMEHVLDTFHNLIKRYNYWAKNNCIMLLPCNDGNTCPER